MNLRHIQIITIAALPLCAFSGNVAENDSIGNEKVTDLQEFVVKAENAYFKDGILTVIPTEKEKNSAISGNDLLRYLQIPTLRYYYRPMPFNFSHMCNLGAKEAKGNLLLFLNDDIEAVSSGWMEELADKALREWAGAVGITHTGS